MGMKRNMQVCSQKGQDRKKLSEPGFSISAPQIEEGSCFGADIKSQERMVGKKSRGTLWALERHEKDRDTMQRCEGPQDACGHR